MLAAGVFFAHQEREEQSSKLAQALGGRFLWTWNAGSRDMPSKNSTAVRRKKKRVESCGNFGIFLGGVKLWWWEESIYLPFQLEILMLHWWGWGAVPAGGGIATWDRWIKETTATGVEGVACSRGSFLSWAIPLKWWRSMNIVFWNEFMAKDANLPFHYCDNNEFLSSNLSKVLQGSRPSQNCHSSVLSGWSHPLWRCDQKPLQWSGRLKL